MHGSEKPNKIFVAIFPPLNQYLFRLKFHSRQCKMKIMSDQDGQRKISQPE